MNAALRRQSLILGLFALLGLSFVWLGNSASSDAVHELRGGTMGTSYSIKVVDIPANLTLQQLSQSTSALLNRLDRGQMSTYAPESELSRINRSPVGDVIPLSPEMNEVMALALDISALTDGAFDVTVGPLVNRWGFGPEDRRADRIPSEQEINALLSRIGSHHIEHDLQRSSLRKNSDIYIDLSGIAKGYVVDKVADHLDTYGISNYFIEIGGELRIRGYKPGNESWVPAIEKPVDTAPQVHNIFYARGEAIAVAGSGDYRNYFEADGVHYSHEIDPQTGMPVRNNLAGIYVIDHTAARADALATAFMVMGAEKAYALAESLDLAVYLITRDDEHGGFTDRHTTRFEHYLQPGE